MIESPQVLEWMNQGRAEGLKEGLKEGRLEALREMLHVYLEDRFGPVPEELAKRIAAMTDVERLRAAVRQLVHIQQRDELQL